MNKPERIRGKVRKWSIREYLLQIEMLVRKVNGMLIKANPAYTSIDAIGVALARGLDAHTASAYLIALRGIERHSSIQKATI